MSLEREFNAVYLICTRGQAFNRYGAEICPLVLDTGMQVLLTSAQAVSSAWVPTYFLFLGAQLISDLRVLVLDKRNSLEISWTNLKNWKTVEIILCPRAELGGKALVDHELL